MIFLVAFYRYPESKKSRKKVANYFIACWTGWGRRGWAAVRGGDRVRHLGWSTRDGEGWEQKDKGWSLSLLFPSTHSLAPILSRSTLSFHLSFLSLLFILLHFLPISFLLVLSLTLIFLTLLYTLKLFIHLVSLAVVPPNIIPLYLPSLSLLSLFLPFPSYWLPGSHIRL